LGVAQPGFDVDAGPSGGGQHVEVADQVVEAPTAGADHDHPVGETGGQLEGQLQVGLVLVSGVALDSGSGLLGGGQGLGRHRVHVAHRHRHRQTGSHRFVEPRVGGHHHRIGRETGDLFRSRGVASGHHYHRDPCPGR